jgi:hypothetical protein
MLTKEIRDVDFPGKGVDKGGSAKAISIKLPTKQRFIQWGAALGFDILFTSRSGVESTKLGIEAMGMVS